MSAHFVLTLRVADLGAWLGGALGSAAMPIYALGDAEPTIHPSAFIHPEAVIIGNVHIGEESSVWPCAVLRGDEGEIRIGDRTSIQDGSVLHTTALWPTTVGDDCVVGHIVHLEGCVIESGCLVGNGSIVLHRALVKTGALVGANAVVTNDTVVPSGAMALGVPAKIKLDAVVPEMISYGVAAYVARAKGYRSDLRRIG